MTIGCNCIDTDRNFDSNRRRSKVIATVPVTSEQSLNSSVTFYDNIRSEVSVLNGDYNMFDGPRVIYYDPSEGYQSAERLYQKAKEKGLSVSRRMVREWLRTQDTYTRYKLIVRKYRYLKTFVKNLADQAQLDLVDMGKYGNKNKGYRWILAAVEILSQPVRLYDTRLQEGHQKHDEGRRPSVGKF